MRRPVRSTNPLRLTLLGAAALAVLLLVLPAAGSYAAWNDSAPLAGTVTTGSLAFTQDEVPAGTWLKDGAAFDPRNGRLTAGTTLTYTASNVLVVAAGDNLRASLSVSGEQVPAAVEDHVTVSLASDPTTVLGSASDAAGRQAVKLVLTVSADGGLPSGAQTIDLSTLTVQLSDGHGWSDTATMDAGTLTTGGGSTAPGGKVDLSFDLTFDDDNVIGFYLQDPAPGTTIRWDAWDTAGKEVVTQAVDGLNSFDHTGSGKTKPWIEITGGFGGFGSPDQTADLIGSLTYVDGMNDDIGMTSASYAFKDAVRLGGISGLPNTLTDTSYAFQNAGSAAADSNIQVTNWDSSRVTTMAHMFDGATNYSQYAPTFDTSNVTDMSYMFAGATRQTGPLNFTSTAKVTTMEGMFQGATSYVGAGWVQGSHIQSWDVSHVTNMAHMFDGATSFNVNLNSWNTSAVTTMRGMFQNASAFSQDLSSWNVARVSDYTDFSKDSGLTTAQLPRWTGTQAAAAPAVSDASTPADDSARPASPMSGTTTDTTTPEAGTGPDTTADADAGADGAAAADSPDPEEQVDPDQAIKALEDAWRNAQESGTDEARQALDDAAKVVDALLGEGTADELVQQLEDDTTATAPSTGPMAAPAGEHAD